jgi:hypothetical protein
MKTTTGTCSTARAQWAVKSLVCATLAAAVAALAPIGHAGVLGLGAATPTGTQVSAAPRLTDWTHNGGGIAYLFAGTVTLDTPNATPHTELAVGAQLNAYANSGSDQIVFGIATEAWALPGSHSMLTGLEATAINMEPDNPWRKISLWSTFKTRPDGRYFEVPADPANLNAQALRIESQPGTGFERGIVLARESLHASRAEVRPILLDLREVLPERLSDWDLIAFPDGCRMRYVGKGRLVAAC